MPGRVPPMIERSSRLKIILFTSFDQEQVKALIEGTLAIAVE
jgi:hypothetical protein